MIQINMYRYVLLVLAISLSACVGCGGPKIVPVEGTVTQDGKGLDNIMVEFWPNGEGPHSFGQTDGQGHFTLTTDDGKQQGALVGHHKVVLKDASIYGDKFLGRAAENMALGKGRTSRISNSYTSADTSPISQEVTTSGNKFEYEVKAK